MFNFIIRLFIKDSDNVKSSRVREAHGRLAGIIGIICNIFLFAFKLAAGIVFGSVSVAADAVNNLSDALSSTVTVVCFKLSNKPADEDHPYGHQRIEYIAAMIVSFVILFIGYELIKTSLDRVLNPVETKFSYIMVTALLVSILVKIFMNRMYIFIGKKINSSVLKATAQDSINDVYSTAAVLISIFAAKLTGLKLDGYMGMAVSLFIMYSGIMLIKETLDPLLGTAPDDDFVKMAEEKILSYDGIIGIHDLMVHNYGPNKIFASVHAEVPAKNDVLESHDIIDNIERDFYNLYDVNLIIHMDPVVTDDENVMKSKNTVTEIVGSINGLLSIHDFRMVPGQTHTNLVFDVAVPYNFEYTDEQLGKIIESKVQKEMGENYYCVMSFDKQFIRNCKR